MPDTSSSVSAYLEASVPRITQYALEVLAQPDNAEPRITQYAVEALLQPDTAEPRITQYAIEVLIKPDSVSNIDSYLRGGSDASDSVSAYLTGPIAASDNTSAFLAGQDNATPDSVSAFLSGQAIALDNIPAYLSGISTLQTDSQSAYTYGQADVTDSTPAFAEGYQDFLTNSTSAYIYGAGEILYPDGDISQSGSWKREDESTTNLYVSIDEQPGYNDSDYVYHGSPVVTDYFEVTLSDPQYISVTAGEARVFWRASRISGTATTTIKVELRENTSVIASDIQTLTADYQTFDFALSQGERDSISDWTDLRLRFIVESIT